MMCAYTMAAQRYKLVRTETAELHDMWVYSYHFYSPGSKTLSTLIFLPNPKIGQDMTKHKKVVCGDGSYMSH